MDQRLESHLLRRVKQLELKLECLTQDFIPPRYSSAKETEDARLPTIPGWVFDYAYPPECECECDDH